VGVSPPERTVGQNVPLGLSSEFGTPQTEKVEKLKSRGVEELSGKSRHNVPVKDRETAVRFSTSRLLNCSIDGTKRECL